MSSHIRFPYSCGVLKKLLILLLFILFILHFLITWSKKTNTCTPCDNKQILSSKKPADIQCEKYNFKTIAANVTYASLPVYDFFLFHDELDLLEIRLYELYNHVTLFLIAESRQTLTGQDKPLYLKENWSKFAKYHDKIRRIEIKLVQNIKNPWLNEHQMRNDGLRLALSNITDKKYLVLTSDADEIPKARFMNALTNCLLPDPFPSSVLICDFYYYSYEFRSKTHTHYGSTINLITYNQSNIPSGNSLRDTRFKFQSKPSSCFHCTWCFNQLKNVRLKMSSYSHTEHNQNQFRSKEHILDRYRYGKDLFDRHGEEYVYIINNTDFPELVKLQTERFMYMTKRSKLPNVGFIDS